MNSGPFQGLAALTGGVAGAKGATAHGWLNNLWTAKRVAEVIRRNLGVDLCIPTVRSVLREQLAWSLQKPRLQLRERDDDEIARWKAEEFPRIAAQAHDRHAYMTFIDESGFMLAPTLRRTYAPRGRAPGRRPDAIAQTAVRGIPFRGVCRPDGGVAESAHARL